MYAKNIKRVPVLWLGIFAMRLSAEISNRAGYSANVSKESIVTLGIFLAFIVLNFATIGRFPIPWGDEVGFADPAANLYFHGIFTSMADTREHFGDFHSFDPLYSLILAGWFEIVGFGFVQGRAFNYLLVALAVTVLWFAVRRSGLVPSPVHRAVLLLLLLFGYSMSFPYRVGRIEPLIMLMSAVAFLFFTLESRRLRIALLSALSFTFAAVGMQFVAFAGIITFVALVFFGRRFVVEILCMWAAMLAGLASLFALYAALGVLDNVISSMMLPAAGSGGLAALLSGGGFRSQNALPKDPSLLVLLGLLAVFAVHEARAGRLAWRSPTTFAIGVALAVPLGLYMTAKFPSYYAWMAYAPIAVCLCAALARLPRRGPAHTAMLAGLGVVCLLGLPLELLLVSADWSDRDHGPVAMALDGVAGKRDWVICAEQAYFDVKPKAGAVFVGTYVPLMTEEQLGKVTLLIGNPEQLSRWRARIGGSWRKTGGGISPRQASLTERIAGRVIPMGVIEKKYRFEIYRRATQR